MRSALWGIVVAGSTLAGWFVLGSGCGALPAECSERYTCPPGIGGSSSASSTTTSTSSGTGGGTPLSCVPTVGKEAVADTCGIFVSSGSGNDTTGDGSKTNPFKTLAAGILAAAKEMKPVYACAETFPEALIVSDGVELYGGLDCKVAWSYTGKAKSTLTASADAVPLTLSKTANGVSLFDFKVTAVDAVIAGGSSIAVIADQVTAAFTRCDLIAGNGMAGVAGATPTDSVGPKSSFDSGIIGNNGKNACPAMGSSQLGGDTKDNAFCPNANGGPLGGLGGAGLLTTGGDGAVSPANPQTALGGKGQLMADAVLNCMTGAGQIGAPGMAGNDGAGATGASAIGLLGISGYTGIAGLPGDTGKPGQGGGGGGGAKGKTMCAGASGGGGGAGGCGGAGGAGGTAGGASIALVSLGATLTLETVTVALGTGGVGGDGAFGQPGGSGGNGGSPGVGDSTAPGTSDACDGGKGGAGGTGGQGGGGRGGHAIGIAATGTEMPDTKGTTFLKKGTPGPGGKGGPMNNGDPGVQANAHLFP